MRKYLSFLVLIVLGTLMSFDSPEAKPGVAFVDYCPEGYSCSQWNFQTTCWGSQWNKYYMSWYKCSNFQSWMTDYGEEGFREDCRDPEDGSPTDISQQCL